VLSIDASAGPLGAGDFVKRRVGGSPSGPLVSDRETNLASFQTDVGALSLVTLASSRSIASPCQPRELRHQVGSDGRGEGHRYRSADLGDARSGVTALRRKPSRPSRSGHRERSDDSRKNRCREDGDLDGTQVAGVRSIAEAGACSSCVVGFSRRVGVQGGRSSIHTVAEVARITLMARRPASPQLVDRGR
jgi:hypothetical protein